MKFNLGLNEVKIVKTDERGNIEGVFEFGGGGISLEAPANEIAQLMGDNKEAYELIKIIIKETFERKEYMNK